MIQISKFCTVHNAVAVSVDNVKYIFGVNDTPGILYVIRLHCLLVIFVCVCWWMYGMYCTK
jgi:hypothetical protein